MPRGAMGRQRRYSSPNKPYDRRETVKVRSGNGFLVLIERSKGGKERPTSKGVDDQKKCGEKLLAASGRKAVDGIQRGGLPNQRKGKCDPHKWTKVFFRRREEQLTEKTWTKHSRARRGKGKMRGKGEKRPTSPI